MLMYYVDFIAFMENPEKTWNDFLAKEMQRGQIYIVKYADGKTKKVSK